MRTLFTQWIALEKFPYTLISWLTKNRNLYHFIYWTRNLPIKPVVGQVDYCLVYQLKHFGDCVSLVIAIAKSRRAIQMCYVKEVLKPVGVYFWIKSPVLGLWNLRLTNWVKCHSNRMRSNKCIQNRFWYQIIFLKSLMNVPLEIYS